MKTNNSSITNENGSVLVIALIMLALLTTLGIMSTNTSIIDIQIAQNERASVNQFNRAEAAAMFAMQMIADATDNGIDLENHSSLAWLHNGEETTTNWNSPEEAITFFRNPDNWVFPATPAPAGLNSGEVPEYAETRFAVIDLIDTGQTEEEGATNIIHIFHCFGLYRPAPGAMNRVNRGEVLVEVGYRRQI